MNSQIVESTLREILEVIKPSEQDVLMRYNFIHELREVVQSVPSLRGATVNPFGSFVSDLFTRWGDLDISIDLTEVSYLSSAGRERKLALLQDLLGALRWKGGFKKLQYIPNARVPILKLESSHQAISCDISIDNLQGQIKSKVLLWLNRIDGRIREMVLLVKEWAKAQNINCSKSGSFNSYSLSLLVIFHFQTCVPAILPPLREIYPGNIVDDLTGRAADEEDRIRKVCASNIAKFRYYTSRRPNTSSLGELFVSFIDKFADINLRATELAICPFTGKWESIGNSMRWMPKKFSIIVEDPFEQPQNSSKGVSSKNLKRISEAFETTRRVLIHGYQNKDILVAKLVRPRVARQILKPPASYHSSGGTDVVAQKPAVHHQEMQVQRPLHSHLRNQNQYQNSRNPPSAVQNQAPKMMNMAPQVYRYPRAAKNEMHPVGLALQSSTQTAALKSEMHPVGLALQSSTQPAVLQSEMHPNGLALQGSTQQNNYHWWHL